MSLDAQAEVPTKANCLEADLPDAWASLPHSTAHERTLTKNPSTVGFVWDTLGGELQKYSKTLVNTGAPGGT